MIRSYTYVFLPGKMAKTRIRVHQEWKVLHREGEIGYIKATLSPSLHKKEIAFEEVML